MRYRRDREKSKRRCRHVARERNRLFVFPPRSNVDDRERTRATTTLPRCPFPRRVQAPSASPRSPFPRSLGGKQSMLGHGAKKKTSPAVLGGASGGRCLTLKNRESTGRASERPSEPLRRPPLNPCLTTATTPRLLPNLSSLPSRSSPLTSWTTAPRCTTSMRSRTSPTSR